MNTQAIITKSVIDGALRFSQLADMLTPDVIREELIKALVSGRFKGTEVAEKLNVAPSRVTEMKNRDRQVQPQEMEALAEMLGLVPASTGARPHSLHSSNDIPFLGKVAQGVWIEETLAEPDPECVPRVKYDRIAGDPSEADLFALEPEGTSMNLAFPLPNMMLICRRIPFGTGDLKSGDYLIVERTAHELRELTCKRVEIDADGSFSLHCESSDPKYKNVVWQIGMPDAGHHIDEEIAITAKVVRAIVNYD